MRRLIVSAALAWLCVSSAFSGTVNFTGVFSTDDQVQLFTYTVQNTGPVEVFTTSFANGGFAPLLALFDSSGNFLFSDQGSADNDCLNNGTDPATGACWDSRMSWNSLGGLTYFIALTEDDNGALGPALADGFFEQGNGNFTAAPPFNPPVPGGAFLLSGPVQRTGAWALTVSSADPTLTAAAVPEPGSLFSMLAAAAVLAGWRRYRPRKD